MSWILAYTFGQFNGTIRPVCVSRASISVYYETYDEATIYSTEPIPSGCHQI